MRRRRREGTGWNIVFELGDEAGGVFDAQGLVTGGGIGFRQNMNCFLWLRAGKLRAGRG